MNKQHAELFATLHQLASTVTTVFEVLADTRQGERQDVPTAPPPTPSPKSAESPAPEEVPTTPPPGHEPKPAEPPASEPAWGDEICLACGRACEVMSARVKQGRICVVCISDSVDDLRLQGERARLGEIASDIHDQLTVLGKLATVAIDDDGARILPILEREVLRLSDHFRTRRGPFVPAPGPTGVVREDAEKSQRSRLEAIASDIHDELAVLRRLATVAIDDDGARSLPTLDREVYRLLNLFRKRQGPFGAATGPIRVVCDEADQGTCGSTGLGAETA
ncbi:MAG: hypothetical protein JNL82_36455 [Myxococcales bacterium]|nr:hypothetical protein [Myxococcales bacterium]